MLNITNKHFPTKTFVAASSLTVVGIVLVAVGGVHFDQNPTESHVTLPIGIIAFVAGIILFLYARKKAKKGMQIHTIALVERRKALEKAVILGQRTFRKVYNPESLHLNHHRRHKDNPMKMKKINVQEVPTSDLKLYRKVLKQWLPEANYRKENCEEVGLKIDASGLIIVREKEVFNASSRLINQIQKNLEVISLSRNIHQKRTIVALDEHGNLQAIAVARRIEGAFWKIDQLATAPHNIKTQIFPMNDHIRVEGAPTAIIEYVVFLSLRTQRDPRTPTHLKRTAVFLSSSLPAVTFYEKLGFQQWQDKYLILQGDHLRHFLRHFGGVATPMSVT